MNALGIVIVGLSITSSWGNGHATTYRGLVRALEARGHRVMFLERDVPWYRDNRDLPAPPYGQTALYASIEELREGFADTIRDADLVIVGSYVPDGVAVSEWVLAQARGLVAFYDIDTPITLAALERNEAQYIAKPLIPRFDLYLSFTGGPTLARLERQFGARRARPLYCSVDTAHYFPEDQPTRWDLGYLGTYAADRQPVLERLLCDPAAAWPAGRFVVAGPAYPASIAWPTNVERIDHLPPSEHRGFYNRQRFTLNVTRADMTACGYAPSVRLFEAAACAAPIVSDWWPGLDELLRPGEEIVIARDGYDVQELLRTWDEGRRRRMGERARARILAQHTAEHRAAELEAYVAECGRPRRAAAG